MILCYVTADDADIDSRCQHSIGRLSIPADRWPRQRAGNSSCRRAYIHVYMHVYMSSWHDTLPCCRPFSHSSHSPPLWMWASRGMCHMFVGNGISTASALRYCTTVLNLFLFGVRAHFSTKLPAVSYCHTCWPLPTGCCGCPYCELENYCEKKQMLQLQFDIIAKNVFPILLWDRTEIDIGLPAIAGFYNG